ncbi:MAG TPA: hypothetical protein VF144_16815 [Chitinophagaceae bacterium]
MSNKHNKKYSKKPTKKENVIGAKRTVTPPGVSLRFSYLNFIPISCALVVFMILWFNPFNVKLKDPWYEAGVLIDSVRKVSDPDQRELLLEQARKKLVVQIQKHPYHARVHYIYGYYWFMKQNWDSTIYQQKEAIRIGAGGAVNQVEYGAQDILNIALGNKITLLMNAGNLEEATKVLENATTPEMYNPVIDKYKGVIFSRMGNIDGALSSFLKYHSARPNDAENLTNIAVMYSQKGMKDSAMAYVNQALLVDPKHANANLIKSQLNSQ